MDVAVVCGTESVGERLSVNYLFYGSQEDQAQQSVRLYRIFHESLLSFWATWGNVCISDCQGEQQRPFWYAGPQTTPESWVLCHQHAHKNKVGLNLGPDMAFVDPGSKTPLSSSKPNSTVLINHRSNKENFKTTKAVSVLSVFPSSSTSSSTLLAFERVISCVC